ncbi:hypothetical protein B0H10DRAFT_2437015 [Mycena sp. CBHHK59/15]|nr:hypothetical protein B0H10DRAFT_2437015 [Mycena sp. CBHHK59/15]
MSRARKTTARRRALDGTCARRSMCRVPIHTFAPLSIVDVGARAATSARRWSRERPPAQHVAGDVWEAGMQVRGAAHPERGAFGGAPEVGDTHGAESPALACGTPDASRPQRVGYPRAALTRRIGRVLAGESIPRRSAPQMTVLGAALRSRSRKNRHTAPSRGTRLRARPAKSAAHGPDIGAFALRRDGRGGGQRPRETGSQYLLRSIAETGWERVRMYTHRVKVQRLRAARSLGGLRGIRLVSCW